MTISLRKTVWREIYAAQISTEISTQKIFEETFPPQTPWRESFTDLFSKKTLKHIEREIAAKKYVKTKFYPNMSVEKCATKQTLNRNLFQASSKRNRKVVWGNMPTQKSLKRNLYLKNIWIISPRKKSNNFSTKNYLERFYQGNSEGTFSAQNIPHSNSMDGLWFGFSS